MSTIFKVGRTYRNAKGEEFDVVAIMDRPRFAKTTFPIVALKVGSAATSRFTLNGDSQNGTGNGALLAPLRIQPAAAYETEGGLRCSVLTEMGGVPRVFVMVGKDMYGDDRVFMVDEEGKVTKGGYASNSIAKEVK